MPRYLTERFVTLQEPIQGPSSWSALGVSRRTDFFAGTKLRIAAWMRNQVAIQHINIVCNEPRIVVEADGREHLDSERDKARDINLAARGFRVLRFWNNDILMNANGAQERILLRN
jgi:very-short-patch-repair endonuclease